MKNELKDKIEYLDTIDFEDFITDINKVTDLEKRFIKSFLEKYFGEEYQYYDILTNQKELYFFIYKVIGDYFFYLKKHGYSNLSKY